METDPELQSFIQQWSPPAPSADLDRRMLSRYRQHRGWRSKVIWFARARLSVPIPALVAALIIAAILFFLPVRRPEDQADPMGGFEPVASPQLIVTRVGVR